jgi:pilus assembly protein FimV
MSRRLNRIWLIPALFLASDIWALGLGDIRLSSALNEPLRAEIELLSATPEELNNIKIQLASAETFNRYGIDRPLFLTRLQFEVSKSGRAEGNVIRVTSVDPIREPFVTFLVEASWARGRLLREYTLLLDPPTFAPPPVAQAPQAVTAPTRSAPADSGQIERPPVSLPAEPEPEPEVEPEYAPPAAGPRTTPPVSSEPAEEPRPFDETAGDEVLVQRGDTLWGIAQRVRPDSRLSMNQTMLAIFEANPEAFAGNINVMSAGASLRIPSADEIYRISRGDAEAEVSRQHESWSGSAGITPTQPSLTLVPPDEEQTAYDGSTETPTTESTDTADTGEALTGDPVEDRIREIEGILADQEALIEIEDNELAALRAELAQLRGEEPPVEDVVAEDEVPVDETVDDIMAEDEAEVEVEVEDETAADAGAETEAAKPDVPRIIRRPEEPGLLDKILAAVTGVWGAIGGALIVVLVILAWFARRAANRSSDDSTGVWNALDAEDTDSESVASTERLRALAREDDTAIVVVEQGRGAANREDLRATSRRAAKTAASADTAASGAVESLEDTFSSETAINLDQSDPVAEADFHMAYGLYDQAADLINGALSVEPERQDLLAKLCEIYYVWGNRDAFIDAATRMKAVAGGDNADWGKVVIMGQQIAGDHEMFSGVSAGAATRAVDLSFEGAMDEASALDMDFAGGPDGMASDVIDLGADSGGRPAISDRTGGIDFTFDEEEEDTSASSTREMPASRSASTTMESPTVKLTKSSRTVETPTIEQQFAAIEATGELPSLADNDETAMAGFDDDDGRKDSTAEINLDDLDLDLAGLGGADMAADADDVIDLSDLDDTSESRTLQFDNDLDSTGRNLSLDEFDDTASTGKNPEVSDTGLHAAIGRDDDKEDTDVGLEIDRSLLDATGMTQVLSDEMAVATGNDFGSALSDEERTMLAPVDEDESTLLSSDDEFDFAKTEALPKTMFTGNNLMDETGDLPGLPAGSTDVDLNLDDLTAALKVSGMGDTVNQTRTDRTIEQPRIKRGAGSRDLDDDEDTSPTQALTPEDISDDLHDARTMTEVGTKLDLARAYVDMGDPAGARSILEEVLDEGDAGQRQQAQKLLDSLPN